MCVWGRPQCPAADVESGSTLEAVTLNIILQYSGGINLWYLGVALIFSHLEVWLRNKTDHLFFTMKLNVLLELYQRDRESLLWWQRRPRRRWLTQQRRKEMSNQGVSVIDQRTSDQPNRRRRGLWRTGHVHRHFSPTASIKHDIYVDLHQPFQLSCFRRWMLVFCWSFWVWKTWSRLEDKIRTNWNIFYSFSALVHFNISSFFKAQQLNKMES